MTPARLLTRLVVTASVMTGSLGLGAVPAQGATHGAAHAQHPAQATAPARTLAAQDEEKTPLAVNLSSMSPAQIPRRGALTLAGTLENRSDEAWTDINVAPFMGSEPITTRDGLDEAARTAPEVSVGNRLTDPGTYSTVAALAPGESTPFTLRIPVRSLPVSGEAGVYWIGIHALGTNVDGRDSVADGRARTFIPLVPRAVARRTTVPVSVVVPFRERARRAADGRLNGPQRWERLTGVNGRLRRLVDFTASAGSLPVTWLVDPAVLDALADFGQGNPPLSLGPRQRADESESPSPEPGGSQDASESAEPSEDASASEDDESGPGSPTDTARSAAAGVLAGFLASARERPLLTVGYADPDVVSLARRRPALIDRADALAAERLAVRDLTGTPTVAPPNGYFDPDLLPEVPEESLFLLTDRGRTSDPVASTLLTGQTLVLTDRRVARGGPSPLPPRDPLALRQRLLAEAALEATRGSGDPRPVVLALPQRWNPGPRWREAGFFDGLDTPWIRVSALPTGPAPAFDGTLAYGPAQLEDEVGIVNVMATRSLARTGTVLANLLANENDVRVRLSGAAFQASSYAARRAPRLTAAQALALNVLARERMEKVQVTGTDFVTLSGGSGSLTVTLVNGLKQPITVGLKAVTDSTRVEIETPDPVDMQPGERTTLRLQVTSGVGIHDVTLFPVTAEGETVGTPLDFNLRTSQVGRLIWYILAAGGTLLTVMIARRIVLRIRDHRWRREETP